VIGLATLRLDGFVSLNAGDEEAIVLTKPFRLKGDALQINVDATQGTVRIDVLDASSELLGGHSGSDATTYREADELRLSPRWTESLASLRGETIRLRFHLTRASLYSFQVTEN